TPFFSPASHGRTLSRPVTITGSPFLMDVPVFRASWRYAETVYQLVSPSIHADVSRSKRRWGEASLKLVTWVRLAVVTKRGSVPTVPRRVIVSVMRTVCAATYFMLGEIATRWGSLHGPNVCGGARPTTCTPQHAPGAARYAART